MSDVITGTTGRLSTAGVDRTTAPTTPPHRPLIYMLVPHYHQSHLGSRDFPTQDIAPNPDPRIARQWRGGGGRGFAMPWRCLECVPST